MRLQIFKLFDLYYYDISFNNRINIMYGENGCGKSTIIKILNCIISCDYLSLASIKFKKIIFTYDDKDYEIDYDYIKKNKIENSDDYKNIYFKIFKENNVLEIIEKNIGKEKTDLLLNNFYSETTQIFVKEDVDLSQYFEIIFNPQMENPQDFESYNYRDLFNNVKIEDKSILNLLNFFIFYSNMYFKKNNLQMEYPLEYSPLFSFSKNTSINSENYVKFDDSDFYKLSLYSKNRIETIEKELIGAMASNCLNYDKKQFEAYYRKFNSKKIQQSLLMFFYQSLLNKGTALNTSQNTAQLISEYLYKNKNNPLGAFYLMIEAEIIENIGENRERKLKFYPNETVNFDSGAKKKETSILKIRKYAEEKIPAIVDYIEQNYDLLNRFDSDEYNYFVDLIKKYIINKEPIFELNFSNVTLKFRDLKTNKILNVSDLSSGEQKIIRIFKNICFKKQSEIALLDEPELSLSLMWKYNLLKDIDNNKGANKIIIATQSPSLVTEEYLDNLILVEKVINKNE